MDDGKKGRLKLRRSSRRLQDSSDQKKKGYREGNESDSEGLSSPQDGQHFKWSLQSELVIKQLGKLFWESGGGGGAGAGGLLSTDVTLVSSDGDCLHAHKVVLILCCPYFRKLFGQINGSVSKENTVVVMGNVKTTCLKNLIRFIYTGEVDITSGEDKEFLKMGEFLGITGIRSSTPSASKTRGGGVGQRPTSNSEEGVIKVHVIQKSTQDDLRDTTNVKVEPPNFEDSGASYFGDSMDSNYGRGEGEGEADDDQGSNFSDEIRGEGSETSGGRRQARNEYNSEEDTMGRGAYKGLWTRTESHSMEDIAENWRIKRHDIGVDGYESWTYYCAHGGQRLCGTALKRVIIDGEEKFYTNRVPHGKHREMSVGLPKETKIFVRSMLEQGIRKPEKIFKAMKLLSMDLPTRGQLVNFIKYIIKKGGQDFPIPERLHPVRKRVREYNPSGRKRGRPRAVSCLPKLNIWGEPCDGTRGRSKKKKGDDPNAAPGTLSEQPDVKLQANATCGTEATSNQTSGTSGTASNQEPGKLCLQVPTSHQPHPLQNPPEGSIPIHVPPLAIHPYGVGPSSPNQFMSISF